MNEAPPKVKPPYSHYGPVWVAATCAALLLWPGLVRNFLASGEFMPHGHCYLWIPALVRLHVLSDLTIGFSYVAISSTLAYLVCKSRSDIPFHWLFLAFGLFIVACGGTHFMEVWTVWHPHYWAAGAVKIVTAAASLATALILPPLVPRVLELVESARLSEQRRVQLEAANARLLAANKELEAFSYSIAHDLRAPLRAIDGYSKILQQELPASTSGEQREIFERVRSNAKRMAQLIDDLLALSHLGRQALRVSRIDMRLLVETAFKELAPGETPRLEIRELPPARGDLALVRQAVVNLLSNAIKFSARRPDALVEVGGGREGREIVYYVKDNGAGFDMKYAGKLFGVFQRLHSETEFEGTGIGLALAHRILERHGGRMWARSAPGDGATFFFALPADGSLEP